MTGAIKLRKCVVKSTQCSNRIEWRWGCCNDGMNADTYLSAVTQTSKRSRDSCVIPILQVADQLLSSFSETLTQALLTAGTSRDMMSGKMPRIP